MNIYNYHKVSENISTSGLPKIEEFGMIKKEGFEIVLSLSMPEDSITIENEELILTNLGLTYLHIPVDYYAPKANDFEVFRVFLNAFKKKKLWIHCTKNYRVSTFVYLYNTLECDKKEYEFLKKFWSPNETWQQYIDDVVNNYR